jgi:hypothetical protein
MKLWLADEVEQKKGRKNVDNGGTRTYTYNDV